MDKLMLTFKIILTNWVHLVGFYLVTYLSIILFALFGFEGYTIENWAQTIFLNLIMILYLIFGYGFLPLVGFFGVIVILDLICFNFVRTKTTWILFLEWVLIIPTFLLWAFKYEYWLWIALIISFGITQWLRERKIKDLKTRFEG